MAILEKIVFDNFSVGGECNLFHHGTVLDCLQNNYFEFYAGNLYGIIGEFGNGGAALSCGITGNTDFYEGKVYIDEQESSMEYIVKNSWYVGSDLNNSKRLFRKKRTIRQQIEYGIHNITHQFDIEKIQGIFNISDERIDRNIEFVSGERWKASVAIGYANGRKVFCYPWMNSKDIEHLKDQLLNTIKYLIDSDCIVIVPTTTEENNKKICSNYNVLYLG